MTAGASRSGTAFGSVRQLADESSALIGSSLAGCRAMR